MEILVVANPISGGGRSGRAASMLAGILTARGHRVELLLTRHAGHAAERIADGLRPERVVAVGGDGTINEIVNGALAAGDGVTPPIAIVPTGTANVLAHELGLPGDPYRAARLVERGATRRLDAGRVRWTTAGGARERCFVCMASLGFDGLVTRLVAERRSGTQGFAAYAQPVLGALRTYRAPRLAVSVDGAAPIGGEWVLASLVRNYAGLFAIADGARPGAGRFEVCVMRTAGIVDIARLALAGLRGGATALDGMVVRHGTTVRVACEATVDAQVDGDWIGSGAVEIELLAGAVRCVVPEPA